MTRTVWVRFKVEHGALLASICWPAVISNVDKVTASLGGPYSVPDALERAQTLCVLWAFNRVVTGIQDRALWRREWGELREHEGLD
jgi:hypothetical protein